MKKEDNRDDKGEKDVDKVPGKVQLPPGYLKMTMRFTMTITMRVKIKTQTTFPRIQ